MTLSVLTKEVRSLKELLQANDLISEDDAASLCGMKLSSFRARVYEKKLEGCYIINKLGKRNYYKSKLLGLDLKQ